MSLMLNFRTDRRRE